MYVFIKSLIMLLLAALLTSCGRGDDGSDIYPIFRVSVDYLSGVEGNNNSTNPSISSNGRYIAFDSGATNLVPGDTSGIRDIFVRDTQTNTTTCVSADTNGIAGNGSSTNPSLSSDGRYVAFESLANNLVYSDTNGVADIFIHDMQTNSTLRVSVNSSGVEGDYGSLKPSISPDGTYVAFESFASNLVSGDTYGIWDVFRAP